jgi:hypothetical protein
LPIDLAERFSDGYAIPVPQNENVKEIMKHFFREIAAIGSGAAQIPRHEILAQGIKPGTSSKGPKPLETI